MPGRVFYLWQVRSFTVRVDLDLVDNLTQALADPRHIRSNELGGILLGRILAPREVEVTDFTFISSEHRRGEIYDLGLREQAAFAKKVAALTRRSGPSPVGFFRTHVRRGLFLDQDDFTLMREAFPDPSQIAMLIRPVEPGPANAGIFLWEEGDIDRRQTPLLFPFDSATLRAQGPIASPFETVAAAAIPRRVEAGERVDRGTVPLSPRLPAIPIRWVAWGATAGAGALALSAALPRLHEHKMPAHASSFRVAQKAQPRPSAAPVQLAQAAPEDTAEPENPPETPAEPAPFVAPKPDEGQAGADPPAKAFTLPRREAVKEEPVHLAVALPPALPAPRLALAAEPAAPLPAVAPSAAAPSVPAPTPTPVRAAAQPPQREKAVRVAVNIEPRESSEIRRVASHVPLLGHLPAFHAEGGSRFSPASPNQPLDPRVPQELASNLSGELAVDVRLSIDKRGMVRNTEILHGAGTEFASLAAGNAGGATWEPAREGDHSVASDVIVHYLFMPSATPASAARQ